MNIPHCNTNSYSGDMDWVPQLYKLPLMPTTVVQETTPGGTGMFKRGCWAVFLNKDIFLASFQTHYTAHISFCIFNKAKLENEQQSFYSPSENLQ